MCHAHAIHIVRPEVHEHRANRFEIIYSHSDDHLLWRASRSSLQTNTVEALVRIKVCQVISPTIVEWIVCTTIVEALVCRCAKLSRLTTVAEVVVRQSLPNAEPFM